MSDLERRLREGRPPEVDPAPETEVRLWRAVAAAASPTRRSPDAWRRGLLRTRGGRMLSIAVLVAAGAGAAALAAGILDRRADPPVASNALAAADWAAPVTLARDIGAAPRPQIAMDLAGDAMVTWSAGGVVQVAYRPRGGTWSPAARLSARGARAGVPSVAFARDGRSAVVVWRERRAAPTQRRVLRFPNGSVAGVINRSTGGEYVLVARRWSPGGDWSTAAEVSEPGRNLRDMPTPQIAPLGRGYMMAWTRGDAVESRTLTSAGDLGKLERVASPAAGSPSEPFLAADGDDALLVWANHVTPPDPAGFATSSYAVRAASRGERGWGTVRQVAQGSPNNPRPVAALSSRAAVVAWSDNSRRGADRVAAARRLPAGGWEIPQMLSAAGARAFAPWVAIDGTGRIVVQWSEDGGTSIATAPSRSGWTPPSRITDAGLAAESSRSVPAVVGDGAGRLVAVFGERPGASVRNWPLGGPFGEPDRAIGETGWQYGVSGLAASPSGSAALVVVGFRVSGRRGVSDVRVVTRDPVGQGRNEDGR